MRKTESQKIALCGVLGALSVVLLLVGAALQIGTYAAPMLAAFQLLPEQDESGTTYAQILYATHFMFAAFTGATVLVYLLPFALLGPAILDELLADGAGMLAALLAAGNLSFWLCDRAVGALTRYYRLILKKKLKFLH